LPRAGAWDYLSEIVFPSNLSIWNFPRNSNLSIWKFPRNFNPLYGSSQGIPIHHMEVPKEFQSFNMELPKEFHVDVPMDFLL